jgi:hypothetical protein
MKAACLLLPVCLLATTGCVTTSPFGLAAPAPTEQAAPAPTPQTATPAAAPQPSPAGAVTPTPAAGNLPASAAARPEPDAVIKLNPGDEPLSREMETRLSAIAARAREDDRILLRLESYVPGGGSPSLNLLRAEQSLHLVRKRLVELDVSPRRILLAPFGGEYVTARDERRQWVEIYLIRPRL